MTEPLPRPSQPDADDDWSQRSRADEWLTPQEIAVELKVNQQSVRNWLRDGLLVGAKFGDVWRVRRSDYAAFVQEGLRRGQRWEANEELRAALEKYEFRQLQAFGGGERVDLIIDVEPTNPKRNELRLTSCAVTDSVENEDQGAFECVAIVEDSDDQPYEDLVVRGRSHSEAFMKVLSAIYELEQRQTAKRPARGNRG